MANETPGGEVIMHPGPKNKQQGIKIEHGSHDVKDGYGGNDVVLREGPPEVGKKGPLGFHNTEVQAQPGNTVQMYQQSETVKREPSRDEEELLNTLRFHSEEELKEIAFSLDLEILEGQDKEEVVTSIAEEIVAREGEGIKIGRSSHDAGKGKEGEGR